MAARPPITSPPPYAPRPSRAARHAAPPPPRSPLRRVLRWALWFVVPVLAVLVGSLIGLLYALAKTPLVDQVPAAQNIVLLARNGAEIGTFSTATENRRIVPFSDIPKVARYAVLAAEDRDYYDHGALSYRGMMRASLANITRRKVSQGGSTITQQYVKNAYPKIGRERSVLRKLKEGVVAVKLEKKYNKDQILGFYLNTVYFGKGAYGVDAAARTYFGHPAKKLTLAESAQLAATIRVPEFYAKKQNARALKARRDFVLRVMRDKGWITPKQAAAAMASRVKDRAALAPGIASSKAPYFLEKVRQYLLDHYDGARLEQSGFRVTTTLDMDMQREAEAAVKQVLDRPDDPLASLVAIDPQTGAVRAMYGGRSFAKSQLNLATDSQRQAGSTMKPFVLQQALVDGYSAESLFPGPGELEIDGVKVHNFGNESFPDITLLDATKHSVNTVYVQLIEKVGPGRVAQLARRTGLDDVIDVRRPGGPDPAEKKSDLPAKTGLALGIGGSSTLQLASAFGTWANQGVHHKAYLVERITDSSGHLIEKHQDPGVRVIDPNIANTVTLALKGVVEGGTGFRAQLPNCQVAGKTGTTNDSVDARFVGYTSNLVSSVWMGYENPDPNKPPRRLTNIHGFGEVAGGNLPAMIWQRFMEQATKDSQCQPFPQPQLTGIVLNSTTTTTTTTTTLPPVPQPQPPQPTFPETTQPQPPQQTFPQTTQPLPGQGPGPTQSTLAGQGATATSNAFDSG
jgi:penicillin-binding protein 1A